MNRLSVAVALAFFPLSAVAVDRNDLRPGLVATFGDGTGEVTRLEPAIAITLRPGETAHPRLRPGTTRAAWRGYINILQPAKYTFAANLGGERTRLAVRVNGRPVPVGTAVELDAGVQPFAAEAEMGDGGRVELLWQGPGFRPEPVPYFVLGHVPKERPAAYDRDLRVEHGRFLFEELACKKCHAPAAGDRPAAGLADRTGPDLSDLGKRVYSGWLDAWLADPAKLRPHTTMPKLFADTPAGRAERYAVGRYLTSLGGPLREPRLPVYSKEYQRSAERGQALFVTAGCAACHGETLSGTSKPADDEDEAARPKPKPADFLHGLGTATGPQAVYTLGAVGSKYRLEELAAYLRNPLKHNPHGRMPNMVLADAEALDLARHLCRVTDDGIRRGSPEGTSLRPGDLAAGVLKSAERAAFDTLPADEQWTDLGRRLLTSKGCVNCHTAAAGGKPLPVSTKPPPLAAIRGRDDGCLSGSPDPAKVPVYPLDAEQRQALRAFLADGLGGAGSPSPVHSARVAVRRFQCLNCHGRDGEGGIGADLAERMRLLEKAENADDARPPRLTGVGHKAPAAWLRSVLTQAGRARPWMTLRMPQYGEANVGFLTHALPLLEGDLPDSSVRAVALTREKIEAGRTLAGKNGHGCVSCHDISGVTGGGTRGPDLALTAGRVRADWFGRWMHNPQRMAPGTRMPQVVVDGRSALTAVFGGDGDRQIEALWAYFALGPGLPLPAGMEPPKGLIVAVKDRPEVLRTFLPDAGTKAVAVGYPGGVSAAFDARQCRLSYAWEGNFLDAAPVWTNRGGVPAKLLGPKFWVAPPGHPWGVTADGTPPDFAKRAADPAFGAGDETVGMKVGFDGYSLDPAGRPTFRYHVAGDGRTLAIADTPGPLRATIASGVSRRFVADVPAGRTAWFLAGAAVKEPRLYGPDGNRRSIASGEAPAGGRLVLPQDGERAVVVDVAAAPAGAAWKFVPGSCGWHAILRLPEGKAEVALNVWSLPRDDEGLLKAIPAR